MKILVLIKQVPDTEEIIKIKEGQPSYEKAIVNPYDAFALEEALRLKEQEGGEISLLSLGQTDTKQALQTGLAMGADKAYHLVSKHKDPSQTACILAQKIKSLANYDLILAGKSSSDTGFQALPQMLAYELQMDFITQAKEIKKQENHLHLKREQEGGNQILIKTKMPVIISVDKGDYEPRYPSLPGIMKARKKPYETEDIDSCPETYWPKEFFYPEQNHNTQMLSGDPEKQVKDLIQILKKEHLI